MKKGIIYQGEIKVMNLYAPINRVLKYMEKKIDIITSRNEKVEEFDKILSETIISYK